MAFTAFCGMQMVACGSLSVIAVAAMAQREPVLIFDDETGKTVELDLRGSRAEVLARLPQEPEEISVPQRGRPRLGVVAREVTLLPRHWQWLNDQPGGASVTLRKLVEQARKQNEGADRTRHSHEAAYRFLSAVAGNLPGYEESLRALFANDAAGFATRAAPWPEDVRRYAMQLGFGADARIPVAPDGESGNPPPRVV